MSKNVSSSLNVLYRYLNILYVYLYFHTLKLFLTSIIDHTVKIVMIGVSIYTFPPTKILILSKYPVLWFLNSITHRRSYLFWLHSFYEKWLFSINVKCVSFVYSELVLSFSKSVQHFGSELFYSTASTKLFHDQIKMKVIDATAYVLSSVNNNVWW